MRNKVITRHLIHKTVVQNDMTKFILKILIANELKLQYDFAEISQLILKYSYFIPVCAKWENIFGEKFDTAFLKSFFFCLVVQFLIIRTSCTLFDRK